MNLKSLVFIFLLLLMHSSLIAQSDSNISLQNDSLLADSTEKKINELAEERAQKLLAEADSIHRADSLEQQLLLQQIALLQSQVEQQTVALQERLDSIKLAQAVRKEKMQQQVDSVRTNTIGIPVVAFEDTLFFIYTKLGAFSPTERAESIQQKLEALVEEGIYDPEKLTIIAGDESHDIAHEDMLLLSITDRDAFWLNQPREQIAETYLETIKNSAGAYHKKYGLFQMAKRFALLILALIVFYLGIKYLNKGFSFLNRWVVHRLHPKLKGVSVKNYEFLSVEQETQVLRFLLKASKWIAIILIVYLALPVIFSIFPATKGIANTLLDYILNPLTAFVSGIIGYIPELFAIIVILTITFYFVKFLGFLSGEVEKGKLQIPGFYPDWAEPTFNLVRVIIYAFSFVIIFPYLPGSDSKVFQGVSVFFGLLISLGSSSAVGNIIAGLVITYMRAFKIGDRVKIGDTVGDVLEKTLLVTRLRTIKNEEVTIPNSAILSGSTVNYSTSALESGLILHSTVTIGYDVPWRQVHELLISAALKTDHIMTAPKPFVFQTSLDDFYVSYQINAYTMDPSFAARIYSQLHANIQDAFNEAGVEILSPHYRAARDGNMVTIPASYLPPDYQPPAFTVNMQEKQQPKANTQSNKKPESPS